MDTIVTCDNGISAADEIARQRSGGMTVIVTDHHEVPYRDTESGREWVIPPAGRGDRSQAARVPVPQ